MCCVDQLRPPRIADLGAGRSERRLSALVSIDVNGPKLPLVQNASNGGSQPKADSPIRHLGRKPDFRCKCDKAACNDKKQTFTVSASGMLGRPIDQGNGCHTAHAARGLNVQISPKPRPR
jgi:hypothetical protein